MSNKLLLGALGGYPLTQEKVAFMQDGLRDMILRTVNMGVVNSTLQATILWGMDLQVSSAGHHSMSEGVFAYIGDLFYCQGGDIADPTVSGTTFGVSIVDDVATEAYRDGVVREVSCAKVAVFSIVDDPTLVPGGRYIRYADFEQWGARFGRNNRDEWMGIGLAVGTGGISGSVKYKKDYLANTLILHCEINVTEPLDFTDAPAHGYVTICTMPSGYRPLADPLYFTGELQSDTFLDSTHTVFVRQFSCMIDSAGDFKVKFWKPATGVGSYTVRVDVMLNLDY